MLTFEEFEKILKNNGYNERDFMSGEKTYIWRWFNLQGYEYKQVRDIISGARKKELWETEGKNGRVNIKLIDLIKHKCSATDVAMYEEIYHINTKFKEYYLSKKIKTPQLDKLISKCLRATKKINGAVSAETLTIAEEDLNVLYNIACIYTSISEHIKSETITRRDPDQVGSPLTEFARVADYIVGTRLGRMKHLEELRKPDIGKQFDEFLDELSNAEENISADEIFTQDDVKEILLSTTSMIRYATAEKVASLRQVISMYKEEVLKIASATEEERNQFAKVSAKNMIMRAGTIMEATPESIKDCVNFLLGKDMRTMLDDVAMNSEDEDRRNLRYIFPDLKITGMTPEKHLYVLNNNVSLFASLKMPTLYSVASGLVECVYQAVCPDGKDISVEKKKEYIEKVGFNTNTLFTGDNFIDALNSTTATIFNDKSKSKYRDNIVKNMQTLLRYVSPTDMQKIMQHNYLLFINDNKKVEEKISSIITKADGRLDVFIKDFNKYINSKFRLPGSTAKNKDEFDDIDEYEQDKDSKKADKFTKETVKISDFNLNNLPELYSGIAVMELNEVSKYLALDNKDVKQYYISSKSSIAGYLAGARLTGYWDKPKEVDVMDDKSGKPTKKLQDTADLMNLRNMRKKREFVQKLNKLIEVCKDIKENGKTEIAQEIDFLIANVKPMLKNRIKKVEESIDENNWLIGDDYIDERKNKKQRNHNIDLDLADEQMEALWSMMSHKNSFISQILPDDVIETGVEKLSKAQEDSRAYAEKRKNVQSLKTETFSLKVEHTYLEKLNKVLDECGLILGSQYQEDDVDQTKIAKSDNEPATQTITEQPTKEELERKIEDVEQYIKNKKNEIKAKFKNKFNNAVENNHKHAMQLKQHLDKAERRLEELKNMLSQLNDSYGV